MACALRNVELVSALISAKTDLFVENFDYGDDFVDDEECDTIVGEKHSNTRRGKTAFDYFPDLHRLVLQKSDQKTNSVKQAEEESEASPNVDPAIFDSGYGSRKINMFDDVTLDKICSILDPPSEDWKVLALYLGVEPDECVTKDDSPTKQIIERFEVQYWIARHVIYIISLLETRDTFDIRSSSGRCKFV
ncbi:hypothetical protein B4U80_11879 [Leptotrombidium deliense]|uniref:Death domain-containing protein n=1 Tax=Leptotrombidium deliense TaxID=299467 RepID=A0A443S1H7_9ACAR|nr:hypothetical protein B4U80_11879 [Leptotrombidium deliense]